MAETLRPTPVQLYGSQQREIEQGGFCCDSAQEAMTSQVQAMFQERGTPASGIASAIRVSAIIRDGPLIETVRDGHGGLTPNRSPVLLTT